MVAFLLHYFIAYRKSVLIVPCITTGVLYLRYYSFQFIGQHARGIKPCFDLAIIILALIHCKYSFFVGMKCIDASFILQKDSNLLGRTDPHSNIFPEIDLSRFDPETKVSRRHARIWLEGETFLVEDLGSVNGTVINDSVRLAPRQPRVLDSGDKLRVGETTLHFLVG